MTQTCPRLLLIKLYIVLVAKEDISDFSQQSRLNISYYLLLNKEREVRLAQQLPLPWALACLGSALQQLWGCRYSKYSGPEGFVWSGVRLVLCWVKSVSGSILLLPSLTLFLFLVVN